MTVWFDVEDLFHFIQSGHKRTSGIQRLTLEIYRAAEAIAGARGEVRFVRHGAGGRVFDPVAWPEIDAQFAVQEEPGEPRPELHSAALPAGRSGLRQIGRGLAQRLPDDVRKPLVLASVTQVQAVGELARFGANLVSHPVHRLADWAMPRRRPSRIEAGSGDRFGIEAKPGDTVLVLGSPWFRQEYSSIARWLRDERRMRFGVLVHDLVPIRRPEWSHIGIARTFEHWYRDVLPFCDLVLANSAHTASDVEAYARDTGIALPRPVQALPVGTGFPESQAVAGPGLPESASYVLFVSTMEARKNHALVVRIWTRLLNDVKAGRRAASSVPDLVFAGRIGWLVSDLVQQLDNTEWLDGRIRMVQDPTDADLRALYRGSLFTIFPSFYEGWGLPVTESLALGKPCLSSNATALPEAGGALCRYFDPENLESAYRAVASVLDDRPGLAAWEEQVRREFRPTPWTETARALLDAVAALDIEPASPAMAAGK